MAQTGFTPIQLYYSSTTTNVPLAANLAYGELAINITDGKLFYKDNANAIQVIGWKVVPVTAGGTGTTTAFTTGSVVFAGASGVYSQNNANFFWDNTNTRLGINNATPTATLEVGSSASTGRYIQVSGSSSDSSYIVLKGSKQYPRLDLEDTAAGGSTFQLWNLGNQLRVGTNPGSASLAAFYVGAGNSADVTFNGNVVIGTSGKGIDFSATSGSGTSELLADYEEGDWTPTDASGAGLSLTIVSATYTKVGRLVTLQAEITYPATADVSGSAIGGLPFTAASNGAASYYASGASGPMAQIGTAFYPANSVGASIINATFSTRTVYITVSYRN
jgi:hypothetical protein